MYKDAWKRVNETLKKCDVLLEVVDSRFPKLCRSTALENKIMEQGKSLLIVLNKSDLIPKEVGFQWVKWFEQHGYYASLVSTTKRLGTSLLRKKIMRLTPKKTAEDSIVGLIGLPNTGKSSLTNILKGRSSAKVAPIPGYTKHQQLFRIGKTLLLYDTPGIIPFSLDFETQLLLGIKSPDYVKDPIHACELLIPKLEEITPGCLQKAFALPYKNDPLLYLEELAKLRGKLKKGGEADLFAIAKHVLHQHMKYQIPVYQLPPG